MTHCKIYFSICGEGYGHSTRCLALAETLQQRGAEVLLASYGYVRQRCCEAGFNTLEVPREFVMWGEKGRFSMSRSIRKSLRPALSYPHTIRLEKKLLQQFGAHCAVADGRGAVAFAARSLGIPVVNITNQTTLTPFFNHPLHRLPGTVAERVMRRTLKHSAKILIPDLPPPYTVCRYTLSRDEHIASRHIFTGPMLIKKHTPPAPLPEPAVLVLLGGHSYRKPIFDAVVEAATELREVHFLISSRFTSTRHLPNLQTTRFLPEITPYLQAANLIITQAGHSTAMELLTYGRPGILIPDSGQIEQESNARAMSELGVSQTQTYEQLNNLQEQITDLLNNPGYAERAEKLSGLCEKLKGAERAADIILNTARCP